MSPAVSSSSMKCVKNLQRLTARSFEKTIIDLKNAKHLQGYVLSYSLMRSCNHLLAGPVNLGFCPPLMHDTGLSKNLGMRMQTVSERYSVHYQKTFQEEFDDKPPPSFLDSSTVFRLDHSSIAIAVAESQGAELESLCAVDCLSSTS